MGLEAAGQGVLHLAAGHPGPDTTLTSAEFREAAATNLCLPSPACIGKVGETVRRQKKVDKYRDNIQSSPLCGDHWRRRHDLLVQFVDRSCMWAGCMLRGRFLFCFVKWCILCGQLNGASRPKCTALCEYWGTIPCQS